MDSFIRWAGSKKQSVRRLAEYWPGESATYLEPFAGSACLFFHLEPRIAVLGDLNSELVSMLNAVRDHGSLVVRKLSKMPVSKEYYNFIRKAEPATLDEIESAARFIYLNRLCFNGLYRTNQNGEFNVPYAFQIGKTRFDFDIIVKASHLLKRATILQADFEETLSLAEKGDFVYLDPPYAIKKRRVFSEYLPNSFCHLDLNRLDACLHRLNRKRVGFVITYGDSAEARSLLEPWKCTRIRIKRNIAGFAADRRYAYEIQATNIR